MKQSRKTKQLLLIRLPVIKKIIKVIKYKNNKIKQEINIYEKQDFNLNTFFTIPIVEYKIKYFNDLPKSKLAGILEIKYYEEYLSI
ncbi:hypothetical protein [Spiroplasma endosymbiont of Polydrusus formosus]|uniref:hypothetical protein n=1 Tax=Spiroplasma endosymbiont of Polydrusus formosus TaxID=3139326 RepID=UPI0035B5194B